MLNYLADKGSSSREPHNLADRVDKLFRGKWLFQKSICLVVFRSTASTHKNDLDGRVVFPDPLYQNGPTGIRQLAAGD